MRKEEKDVVSSLGGEEKAWSPHALRTQEDERRKRKERNGLPFNIL